jgi:hypothetical protein
LDSKKQKKKFTPARESSAKKSPVKKIGPIIYPVAQNGKK